MGLLSDAYLLRRQAQRLRELADEETHRALFAMVDDSVNPHLAASTTLTERAKLLGAAAGDLLDLASQRDNVNIGGVLGAWVVLEETEASRRDEEAKKHQEDADDDGDPVG